MAKYLIWPDLYKEHGHWLPCVNLASSLKALNGANQVEFMGIPDCASIVSPYGATFNSVLGTTYPIGHSIENKLEPVDQRWKPAHLMPLARGEEGIDALFTGSNKPDVLICGYFSALEALLLHHKYHVPIVIMTTYLRHPDDDPAIFAKTKLVYMSRAFVSYLFETVGLGDKTIEEFIHPLEYRYPEIIPCPQELDFDDEDWIHSKNVVYAEPMVPRVLLDPPPAGIPRPPNLEAVKDIPLIFATSGSQVQDYEAKAREFFRNLILMMQTEGMDKYFLLASVGTKLKKELEATFNGGANALPANVQLVEWASQLEILNHPKTKAVFMHGGLATIKEAIAQTVPMVIVPHGKDQQDNALRLHRKNLALVAQQGDLSPLNLRKLLMEAMSSHWMATSVAQMQTVFDAQDKAAAALKRSIRAIEHARHDTWEANAPLTPLNYRNYLENSVVFLLFGAS